MLSRPLLHNGTLDFSFAGLSVMLPHVKAGKVKAIAVSSPDRSKQLPDVPTMNESIPGFEYPTWIGLVGPKGLPEPVRQKILKAVRDVMHDPQVERRFADNAFDIVNSSPEVFATRVRKDSDIMADLVKRKIVSGD